MSDDSDIFGYLEKGGRISAPYNAPPRYRAELLRMAASFVDSELAGAAGFADRINDAPTIKARIAGARIVMEKLDHAETVLGIMGEFGANTARYETAHTWSERVDRNADLGSRRRDGDMRLNVFHYPVADWLDAVVMNVLMGRATVIQLRELAGCSYQPLAEAFESVLPRERRHMELGEEGLEYLRRDPAQEKSVAQSIAYWTPRVEASFGGAESARFDLLKKFGLRRRPNSELLAEWREDVRSII